MGMNKQVKFKFHKVPEYVFKVFHFLVARLVGFAVIQKCSGIGHGTCIHLHQNMSVNVKHSYTLINTQSGSIQTWY